MNNKFVYLTNIYINSKNKKNNLKQYLLEANRRCSFKDNNSAEKYYTYNIVIDTLNIIGLIEYE